MSEIFYFESEDESDMFCAVLELLEPDAEITIIYPADCEGFWAVGVRVAVTKESLYRIMIISDDSLRRWSSNPLYNFSHN